MIRTWVGCPSVACAWTGHGRDAADRHTLVCPQIKAEHAAAAARAASMYRHPCNQPLPTTCHLCHGPIPAGEPDPHICLACDMESLLDDSDSEAAGRMAALCLTALTVAGCIAWAIAAHYIYEWITR